MPMPQWDQFSRPRVASGGGFAQPRMGGSMGNSLSRMMGQSAPYAPNSRPWPQRRGAPVGPDSAPAAEPTAEPAPAPDAPAPTPDAPTPVPTPEQGAMANAAATPAAAGVAQAQPGQFNPQQMMQAYQNMLMRNYAQQFGGNQFRPGGPGYSMPFQQGGGFGRMSVAGGAPPQGIRPLQPQGGPWGMQGMQSMQRRMPQPQPIRPMPQALAGRRAGGY